jgi:hypothetical protein
MAESVLQLLDDPKLAEVLGTAGRDRVARLYSHDASAQLVADVYEDVLTSPLRTARRSA